MHADESTPLVPEPQTRRELPHFKVRHRDGSISSVSLMIASLENETGATVNHLLSFLDQTPSITADEIIRRLSVENASLKHQLTVKDRVIAEIEHRIRNSLMQASALLNMEKSRQTDPRSQVAINRLQGCMEAMAGLHQMLGERAVDGLSGIDLGDYIDKLTGKLSALNTHHNTRAATDRGILVSPDTARTIGLLVMELVTNAWKHAFPENRSGTVRIGVRRDSGGICVSVRDDGIGTAGIGNRSKESLGYQLIIGFVDELAGQLDVRQGEPGTIVNIRLPIAD